MIRKGVQDQLVVVELSGVINSDYLTQCVDKCKIVGIDTEQPVMQVGRYVFAGEYEDALGTCVIFEENADHDLESEVKPQLKYKCHTVKKLMMKRTFLSEKKEGEEGSGGIEVLQLSDGDFSGRPNMICSFLPKSKEVVGESSVVTDVDPTEVPHLSSGSEGEVSDLEPVDLSQETNCSVTDPDTSACEQPESDTGITDPVVACDPLK
ncbi:general transcription factor 3C polypeptide 6-like isoform X2 [Polyodon spathula]|uniref:general transcription factor 3C polypeptide 6-like isoform X2 n=1 Tax=Polyodon spathula TaxID=7913 RepID=UPI001B7DA884|nr:general transcription factor 3C polypeptide 6-like isoform X2 [Polyodon spathula]